jgi:hypothetical protein
MPLGDTVVYSGADRVPRNPVTSAVPVAGPQPLLPPTPPDGPVNTVSAMPEGDPAAMDSMTPVGAGAPYPTAASGLVTDADNSGCATRDPAPRAGDRRPAGPPNGTSSPGDLRGTTVRVRRPLGVVSERPRAAMDEVTGVHSATHNDC